MILVPSYKRPNNCITAKWLGKVVICCHEKEEKAYRGGNKNEIMVMPDELIGKGMGVIRNWILDNSEGDVLMMDDLEEYKAQSPDYQPAMIFQVSGADCIERLTGYE